jgi:quercetin dioxygenase-like cupin family protein
MTTDAPTDLHALAGELLATAQSEHAGRAGRTLPHPVDGLRQTVIALRAGAELSEHESPGAATLLVIRGRVRLVAGEESVPLGADHICPIPNRRHSLHADEDAVVLLSVAVPARSPQAG